MSQNTTLCNQKYVGNLLIGQSGGPTAVINSSLAGAVQTAMDNGCFGHIYGMLNGIKGYSEGTKIELTSMTEEELRLLQTTPSMYLGSCRFKLPAVSPEDPASLSFYQSLFQRFEEDGIRYVLYIGGNDSMDTVDKLSAYAKMTGSDIRFVGVPKTIDNDLVETDHTPGFGSAAKFVAQQIRQLSLDTETYKQDSILVVEIMGRHAGWLTGASALARKFQQDNPCLIYLPEVDFDENEMLRKLRELLTHRNHIVICVSEGIHDKNGTLICQKVSAGSADVFGNRQLSGCGKYLENLIHRELGTKVRSVELNVTQRSGACSLSRTDVEEAFTCGSKAVEAALRGETGVMTVMHREEGDLYQISYETKPVSGISNSTKYVPLDWIEGDDVNAEFLAYVRPLIQGDIYPPTEDGLPVFLYRDQSNNK